MFGYGIKAYGMGSVAAMTLIFAIVTSPSATAENLGLVVAPLVPSVPDLAGHWRFALMDDDNVSREINLTLHQASKDVFGVGNMTADNVTRRVVAVGSLVEDFLNLYLIAEEGDFMLRLTFGKHYMGGYYYRGYSSDGAAISGNGSGYGLLDHRIDYAAIGPKPKQPPTNLTPIDLPSLGPQLRHPPPDLTPMDLSSLGPKPDHNK